MSEYCSNKLKKIAVIKNYDLHKNKHKQNINLNNLLNPINKNKHTHYYYNQNNTKNRLSDESSDSPPFNDRCCNDESSDSPNCNNRCCNNESSDSPNCNNRCCNYISSDSPPCKNKCYNKPSNCKNCTRYYNDESSDFKIYNRCCDDESYDCAPRNDRWINENRYNKPKKLTYHKKANLNIRNLKIERQDFNLESHILKLNTSNYIFSENITENLDILINTWQNIVYSIFKYKAGVEHLLNEISDNIELNINELKMNFRNLKVINDSLANELIMASKTLFTNKKNVFSVFISRNNTDYDTMFSHIITKPKKFTYYLDASNTLTLFNIPIFAINIDQFNNLVIQIIRQEESVSTTHQYSKINPTIYKLTPRISCKNEFFRNNLDEKTDNEKCINLENSFKFLSHYYCSIINDLDIYHYPRSDLTKLLNDLNIEIEKLNYIKRTYCNI